MNQEAAPIGVASCFLRRSQNLRCECVGVWVCGCVGVWVCGCVGVWVCGCVGEGAQREGDGVPPRR
jgi:hypothetical protein